MPIACPALLMSVTETRIAQRKQRRRHLARRGQESLAEQFVYDIACNLVQMRVLAILEYLRPVSSCSSEHGSVAREDPHSCRVNALARWIRFAGWAFLPVAIEQAGCQEAKPGWRACALCV